METGPDFHETHVLDDGTPVTLRHVRPDDAAELRRGFERLSPSSRYRRFLSAVNALSDEAVRYLTCVDGHDHVALVAVTRAPGSDHETGLGIARFIRAPEDPAVAEAAITVVDDAQGKGLGRILGMALARAALERNVRRFRGEILADNEPVRQLLDEVGAVVQPSSNGSVVFEVDLGPAESHAPGGRSEIIARRMLRAAASFLAGLIRGLAPGEPPRARNRAQPT
jgi:GNAT superfamily N-acetyltransferase